jgi:hypothetical protein
VATRLLAWWFVLTWGAATNMLTAQQAGSIDLTGITSRMSLRRPPLSAGDPTDRHGRNQESHFCGPVAERPDVLTTLVSLDRSEYRLGDEPRFDLRITNIGSKPLSVPFSPHLADLQPSDPAAKFAYHELQIELFMGGARWSTNNGGFVKLYGSDQHHGTMLVLQPGERAEILGKGHIRPVERAPVATDPVKRMYARIQIFDAETMLTSTDSATVEKEFCLNQKMGQDVPVKLVSY